MRIATERYTDNPRSAREDCVHITNFDVNRRNGEKFLHSSTVSDVDGHKVRDLTCFFNRVGK